MRVLGLLVLTAGLAGCGGAHDFASGPQRGGRYQGIGIYSPGPLWERLAAVAGSADPQAATLRDDDEIIVVVDSQTGEIRQCGNLSGHCIRMNPWTAQRSAPASVTEHQADLDRVAEDEAAARVQEEVAAIDAERRRAATNATGR